MDVNVERNIIFTGSGEGEVKAWSINTESISKGLTESDSGEVRNHSVSHRFVALKLLLDQQNYTSHSYTSSVFTASRISNILSSHSAIFSSAIS